MHDVTVASDCWRVKNRDPVLTVVFSSRGNVACMSSTVVPHLEGHFTLELAEIYERILSDRVEKLPEHLKWFNHTEGRKTIFESIYGLKQTCCPFKWGSTVVRLIVPL